LSILPSHHDISLEYFTFSSLDLFDLLECAFQVKIAIIGILAAGFGLDFSTAQDVVFLELPQSPTVMLQVLLDEILFSSEKFVTIVGL
jgi:hypothetical protein